MKISQEVKSEIKMFQANDYEVEEETPEYILMKKNTATIGIHILLAVIFWWLLFTPNIAYHFGSIKKKKIMK